MYQKHLGLNSEVCTLTEEYTSTAETPSVFGAKIRAGLEQKAADE